MLLLSENNSKTGCHLATALSVPVVTIAINNLQQKSYYSEEGYKNRSTVCRREV